jgi:hypothetical protein
MYSSLLIVELSFLSLSSSSNASSNSFVRSVVPRLFCCSADMILAASFMPADCTAPTEKSSSGPFAAAPYASLTSSLTRLATPLTLLRFTVIVNLSENFVLCSAYFLALAYCTALDQMRLSNTVVFHFIWLLLMLVSWKTPRNMCSYFIAE